MATLHRRVWSALGLLLLSLGCVAKAPSFATGYAVGPERLLASPLPGSLGVRSFEDQRPPRYYASPHRAWMAYIPLLPYVSFPYERVDETIRVVGEDVEARRSETKMIPGKRVGARRGPPRKADSGVVGVPSAPPFESYRYPDAFARAVAQDLAAAGLFEEVRYLGDSKPDRERYLLEGVLRETPVKYSITSYGLGFFGVYLWILPIPLGNAHSVANVDLTLTDRRTGEVVWQTELEGRVSRLFMLYNDRAIAYGAHTGFQFQLPGPPNNAGVEGDSVFAWNFAALRAGMAEARGDLARSLERYRPMPGDDPGRP